MQIDLIAASGIGVLSIKRTNGIERIVGPVTGRRVGGESNAIGKEHGMSGDVLRGVEIFRDERRGHHQSLPGIRESFAGSAVSGKLRGGIECLHSGKVANRVGVFAVI